MHVRQIALERQLIGAQSARNTAPEVCASAAGDGTGVSMAPKRQVNGAQVAPEPNEDRAGTPLGPRCASWQSLDNALRPVGRMGDRRRPQRGPFHPHACSGPPLPLGSWTARAGKRGQAYTVHSLGPRWGGRPADPSRAPPSLARGAETPNEPAHCQ